MRKNILFILLGILSGIGIFILDMKLGFYIFVISLILSLVFFIYNKSLMYFSLALLVGFFYASVSFSSYKLIEKDTRILKLTITEKKDRNDYWTYTVRADDLKDNISEKSVFSSDDPYDIGDVLLVKAQVDLADKNTNPYLFSYRSYLLSKKVKSKLEIKEIYGKGRTSSVFLKLRDKFYRYIHKIFNENLSSFSSSFASAVILGDSMVNGDEIKDLGLSHILAVSGLHVDILVTFILFIFTSLNINYKYGLVTALGLCFFYGYLIAFPFSVQRVLIMTSISYLSFVLKEPEDKKKSLLIAGLLIVLINPFAVLSAGFILSFAAATGIYVIYPKLRYLASKSYIVNQLIFALAIQIGIFPFLLYYYGKINLISIFANFLIIPIFEISMYIIFGLIILFPLFRSFLYPIFKLLDFLLLSILDLSKFLAYFKIFNLDFKKESFLFALYFFILVLVILFGKKTNKLVNKLFLGLSIILVGFLAVEPYIHNDPTFSMVDIGQGDTFILKDGSDVYLFDTGGPKTKNFDSGEKTLVPLLKAMGVKDIKAVFISHLDRDHVGNLDILSENFKVHSVISTPLNQDGLSNYNFLPMEEKDRVQLKNGYVEAVFDGIEGDNKNNKSLGLLINIRGTKILWLGDLEKEYEDKLKIRADILKLSHHGSSTSTSKEFLDTVTPQLVLISAGRNNTYGHPNKEVLENVKDKKIYNTQEDGYVEIKFVDDTYKVEPYLKGDFFQ